jgi:hypothetical protein
VKTLQEHTIIAEENPALRKSRQIWQRQSNSAGAARLQRKKHFL